MPRLGDGQFHRRPVRLTVDRLPPVVVPAHALAALNSHGPSTLVSDDDSAKRVVPVPRWACERGQDARGVGEFGVVSHHVLEAHTSWQRREGKVHEQWAMGHHRVCLLAKRRTLAAHHQSWRR